MESKSRDQEEDELTLNPQDYKTMSILAIRHSSKRGFLLEIDEEKRTGHNKLIFACLYTNILFLFKNEYNNNTLYKVIFLEGCSCKLIKLKALTLIITSISGESYSFLSTLSIEHQDSTITSSTSNSSNLLTINDINYYKNHQYNLMNSLLNEKNKISCIDDKGIEINEALLKEAEELLNEPDNSFKKLQRDKEEKEQLGKKSEISIENLEENIEEYNDLLDWTVSISNNKWLIMNRKVQDIECSSFAVDNNNKSLDDVYFNYEKTISELSNNIILLNGMNEKLKQTIGQQEVTNNTLNENLKKCDEERLLVLKSRGIIPKTLPEWATDTTSSSQPSSSVPSSQPSEENIKIWSGTWNLSQKDPLRGYNRLTCNKVLQVWLPQGYDLYVISLQEVVNDSIIEVIDDVMLMYGCRKINSQIYDNISPPLSSSSGSSSSKNNLFNYSYLSGTWRLISMKKKNNINNKELKYIGTLVYCRSSFLPYISSLVSLSIPCDSYFLNQYLHKDSFKGDTAQGNSYANLSNLNSNVTFDMNKYLFANTTTFSATNISNSPPSSSVLLPWGPSNGHEGAVVLLLSIFGRNLLIINSLLNEEDLVTRMIQYQFLTSAIGSILTAHLFSPSSTVNSSTSPNTSFRHSTTGNRLSTFSLASASSIQTMTSNSTVLSCPMSLYLSTTASPSIDEMFHHTIWLGSFYFSFLDKSCNKIPLESILLMLKDIRLLKTLSSSHDEFNFLKKNSLSANYLTSLIDLNKSIKKLMSNNKEKDEEILMNYLNNNNKKIKNLNNNNSDIFASYFLNSISFTNSSISSLLDCYSNFVMNLKGLKIFFRYREPIPFPNFIPSYKLLEYRQSSKKKKNISGYSDEDFDIDFLDPNWITLNYSFQADDEVFSSSSFYNSLSSNLSVDQISSSSPNPQSSSRFNFLRRKESKLSIDPSSVVNSSNPAINSIPSGLTCPVPSFVNRIFYTSMTDLVDDLIPEPLEINFQLLLDTDTSNYDSVTTSQNNSNSNRISTSSYSENERDSIRSSTISQRSEEDEELLQSFSSSNSFSSNSNVHSSTSISNSKSFVKKFNKNYNIISTTSSSSSITTRVDNYKSLNSGDIFANSNHLPISCSFLLKTPASSTSSSSIPTSIVPKLGIRITDIKVLFGADDFVPLKIRILFPTPFEFSPTQLLPSSVNEEEDNNLLGPSFISDSSFPLFSSDVLFLNSFNEYLNSDNITSNPIPSSGVSSPVKNIPPPPSNSFDSSCLNSHWESLTPKFSSSLCLESWRGGMSKNSLSYPPLVLTWKHSEISLENLHIGFFVTLPPSLQASSSPTSPSSSTSPFETSSLLGSGQCSVSVSQIYRAALRSSGITGAQTITRLLLSQGHPLTTSDDEFLTFTCKLELVPL